MSGVAGIICQQYAKNKKTRVCRTVCPKSVCLSVMASCWTSLTGRGFNLHGNYCVPPPGEVHNTLTHSPHSSTSTYTSNTLAMVSNEAMFIQQPRHQIWPPLSNELGSEPNSTKALKIRDDLNMCIVAMLRVNVQRDGVVKEVSQMFTEILRRRFLSIHLPEKILFRQ